ncbi:ganglioside GM2 activator-like [Rhinoraja longicauda]
MTNTFQTKFSAIKVIFAILCCLGCGSTTSHVDNGNTIYVQLPNAERRSLATFSWANCGSEKEPAVLEALSIQPDPIVLPGDLQASATGSTSVILTTPLTGNLTLYKEVIGMWERIPCIDDIGSCVYNDVCELLNMLIPPGQTCPEPLLTYGLPCHCPFHAGKYSLPKTNFNIPYVQFPYWMANGNYKAVVILTSNEEQLACVKLAFSLKSE